MTYIDGFVIPVPPNDQERVYDKQPIGVCYSAEQGKLGGSSTRRPDSGCFEALHAAARYRRPRAMLTTSGV